MGLWRHEPLIGVYQRSESYLSEFPVPVESYYYRFSRVVKAGPKLPRILQDNKDFPPPYPLG